jgi:hypothetical protein
VGYVPCGYPFGMLRDPPNTAYLSLFHGNSL